MKDIILVGVGATLVMDAWGLARKPLFGMPSPDYRLVGRWVGYTGRGRFRHESIAAAEPLRHEALIGWTAHYLTGIVFAAMLVAGAGTAWIDAPTLGPALLVGLGTTALPFLVMQPATGLGIAASRAPRPGVARLQTLVTHIVFGVGMYAAAWLA